MDVNDDHNSSPEAQILSTKRQRLQKTPEESPSIVEDNGTSRATGLESKLFTAMKQYSISMTTLANTWITNYHEQNVPALADLLQLFINVSGSNIKITPDMLNNMELSKITDHIQEKYVAKTTNLLLDSGTFEGRCFSENFDEFVQLLFLMSNHSITYDEYFLSKVIGFLIPLSDCHICDLRHVMTKTALKIMTAMVKIDLMVLDSEKTVNRQILEHNETSSDENSSLKDLQIKLDELKAKRRMHRQYMDPIYQHVFDKRAIDHFAKIRMTCLAEFKQWLHQDITTYLKNSTFLKFIMYDESNMIRSEAITMLREICAMNIAGEILPNFLEDHIPRFVALTCDKAVGVAVDSINLLLVVMKNYPKVIDRHDITKVYELVFSKQRRLARAAGKLLEVSYMQMQDLTRAEANSLFFKNLIDRIPENNCKEHASYLVDALIDSCSIAQDWKLMTDYLLDASYSDQNTVRDVNTCKVAWVLCSSVIQSATGQVPYGREPPTLGQTKTFQTVINDATVKLTKHLIPILPIILRRFSDKGKVLAPLLYIPRYYDFTLYTENDQQYYLKDLMNEIGKIIRNNTEDYVLVIASELLVSLYSTNHVGNAFCWAETQRIFDSFVLPMQIYAVELRENKNDNSKSSETVVLQVQKFLKKVDIFYVTHNLNRHHLFILLSIYFEIYKDDREPSHVKCIINCIGSAYHSLLWYLVELKSKRDSTALSDAQLLKIRVSNFVGLMQYFLRSTAPYDIKVKAYRTICDFVMCFHKSALQSFSEIVQIVAYEPDAEIPKHLNKFLEEFLFTRRELVQKSPEEYYNQRVNLMAFCKLITCNIIEIISAANVFTHYKEVYTEYGDIMRAMLIKARNKNSFSFAIVVERSLNIVFNNILNAKEGNVGIDDLGDLIELAKLFVGFFDIRGRENNTFRTQLHFAGIEYIFHNTEVGQVVQKVPYFLVMTVFSSKLNMGQKNEISKFLKVKTLRYQPFISNPEWDSLRSYTNSLGAEKKNTTTPTKRGRGRPRKNANVQLAAPTR